MSMTRLAILVALVGLINGCAEEVNACDEASSRLVARSYVLTMPLLGKDDEMIPLMRSNPGHFTPDGGAIQCMESLGAALVRGGLKLSREYSGGSAQEKFGGSMPQGLAHLPGQVDQSMNNYGSNMFTMGQELLWLAKVLPSAAQGNYTPYNTPGTPTRKMASQVMPVYRMLCQMDPSICQLMLNLLNEMAPQIEQQIYILARQLRS